MKTKPLGRVVAGLRSGKRAAHKENLGREMLKVMASKREGLASCTVYVLGADFACPLCGAFVKSGTTHTCHGKSLLEGENS